MTNKLGNILWSQIYLRRSHKSQAKLLKTPTGIQAACPDNTVSVLKSMCHHHTKKGMKYTHQSHGVRGLGSLPWRKFSLKAWATRVSAGFASPPVPAALPPGALLLMRTPTPDQPSPQSNKEKKQAGQLERTQRSSSKNSKNKQKFGISFMLRLKSQNLYCVMTLLLGSKWVRLLWLSVIL